jgi:ankyrin repeat protein
MLNPSPTFDVLIFTNLLLDSLTRNLGGATSEISILSNFTEDKTDDIERLIESNQISLEDKLSGLQIALTKRKSPNDSFDKIIQKLSTCDDLIIRVCEDANLKYFNALTDNGNRKLTPDQISKIKENSIFNRDFAVRNLDFFKSMVQAGLEKSLKAGDKNGRTALHEACAKDDLNYAKALIQAGGEELLKVKDNDGRTALYYACIKENLLIAIELIESGGEDLLNSQNINGRTVLHEACAKESLIFVETLIRIGRKELLKVKDKDGRTALHYACIIGNFDLADNLIEAGGEELLKVQDNDGRTALHYACIIGNFDLANKLIEVGGKDLLNTKDKDGKTAFHYACSNSNLIYKRIEFINKLIENPDLEFCKDFQDIPYNASDYITNQILAIENFVLLKIFKNKTTEKTNKFYYSGNGMAQNLQVMTFLHLSEPNEDLSEDEDLSKIDPKPNEKLRKFKRLTRVLDPATREIILKYPIDEKLIETEIKLIDELNQIRTKLINKEKERDFTLAGEPRNNPSSETSQVSCFSRLKIFR